MEFRHQGALVMKEERPICCGNVMSCPDSSGRGSKEEQHVTFDPDSSEEGQDQDLKLTSESKREGNRPRQFYRGNLFLRRDKTNKTP